MAADRPTGLDEPVRPEDVQVEEALIDVEDDEDALPEEPALPEEANEADVLEQREVLPVDDEDEVREPE